MTAVHTINVNGLGWVDADPDIEQIRIRFGNEHKQDTLIVSPAWLVGGLIRALRQAEALSTDPPANAGHMDFELSDVPLSDLMSEMDRCFRASSGGPAVLVPLSLCEQIMPLGWDAPDTPWGQFRALVANSGVEAETRVLAPSLGDSLGFAHPLDVCAECGEVFTGSEHFHVGEPHEGCDGARMRWQVRGSESDLVAEVPDEAMCRRIVATLNGGAPSVSDEKRQMSQIKQCDDCGENFIGAAHFHAVEVEGVWHVHGSGSGLVARDQKWAERIAQCLNWRAELDAASGGAS